MPKPKVYVASKFTDDIMARVGEVCEYQAWAGEGRCPTDVFEREIADVEGVLGHYPFNAGLMDKAPRLRVIASLGVGFDHIDIGAASQRGILVTNTPDVLTDTTADLAFALLMAVARRVGEGERFIRSGKWTSPGASGGLLGRDVHHATLGIVGMGRIGATVARRGLGFDMKVLYYDVVRREDLEKEFGYRYVDLDTLLRESDFVSLHMPLMPPTTHLIGAAELAKMKPTAFLVNAARGPVVDEEALIEALREGRIAGAGLDVFEKEPTDPNNPLLSMENVVVLPHVGSATVATRLAMAELAANNLIAVMQGKAPLTPVNPQVLAKIG